MCPLLVRKYTALKQTVYREACSYTNVSQLLIYRFVSRNIEVHLGRDSRNQKEETPKGMKLD